MYQTPAKFNIHTQDDGDLYKNVKIQYTWVTRAKKARIHAVCEQMTSDLYLMLVNICIIILHKTFHVLAYK